MFGDVYLHDALARSLNLATVDLGMRTGVDAVVDMLAKLGHQRQVPEYLSLLLGAVDMAPLEVARFYQTLASNGFYSPLRSVEAVTTGDGDRLQRYGVETEQVADASSIFLLEQALQDVFGQGTARSVAGSSGGSAAALASGTAWLASGSDLGGSLRNPASFCGIVGFRPSPGRVAHGPSDLPFMTMSVEGPMARNVPDVALMLDAMAGQHPVDPISLARPEESFTDAVKAKRLPKRVALSTDLGGITPVDAEVAAIVEKAAKVFEDMGCIVEQASPDFSDVQMVFQTLRAMQFAASKKALLESHRDLLKPEVVWNIEKGLALTMEEIAQAELARGRLYHRVEQFYRTYDLVLSPATIVPPYPVEHRYVEECNGHTFSNYIEWCTVAYAFTCASCPAMSVPAGFTADGLPVGLQIAGRPCGEADLLSAAALYEAAAGLQSGIPIDPRPGT
jgi:amidase